MLRKSINRWSLFGLMLPVLLFSTGSLASAGLSLKNIEELDNRYHRIIGGGLARLSDAETLLPAKQLAQQIAFKLDNNERYQAVLLAYRHKALLLADTRKTISSRLIDHLFALNQGYLIEQIRLSADSSGDDTTLALIQLHDAAHQIRQGKWQRAPVLITPIISELAGRDLDYANLLLGIALQKKKQHRKAADLYQKINKRSDYYLTAQVNLTTAFIRQGWTSDIKKIVESIDAQRLNASDRQTYQRLLLVYGYALIAKEQYGNAQQVLSSIDPNSRYVTRALLGLILSTTSQRNYPLGLKKTLKLQRIKGDDLPSHEAYLIPPMIYARMGRNDRVVDSYLDASSYYHEQIARLKTIMPESVSSKQVQVDFKSETIKINGISLEYSEQVPESFFTNWHILQAMQSDDLTFTKSKEYNTLIDAYEQQLQQFVAHLSQQKLKALNSYLSQTRYGLARHYDSQQAAK